MKIVISVTIKLKKNKGKEENSGLGAVRTDAVPRSVNGECMDTILNFYTEE